jgi:hypothetical protein
MPNLSRLPLKWALLGGVSVLCGLAMQACSANKDNASSSNFGGSGGASSGTNTGSGTGSMSNGTGVGGAFTTSSATSTGSASGGGCAGTSVKAQLIPLDMYIMLDQSLSMEGTKWTSVTNAIATFVQQPSAAGIGVGLQYFGLPPAGCSEFCTQDSDCMGCDPGFATSCTNGMCDWFDDSCNAADYAKPEVPVGVLPGNSPAIQASLAKHHPLTITPTAPALQGGIDFCKTYAAANPSHTVVHVFATDGDPTECDPMAISPDIANIAKAGATGNPKVLTFVIGVGSSVSNLDAIASAGGTQKAFIVDMGNQGQQQFLDALNKIRGTALACTYQIPQPMGQTPDYNQVNVTYTPGGGSKQTIPKVKTMADCGNGDGWYYDSDANPQQIIMCPATCSKLSQDSKGQVDIVIGCDTIVK